MKIENLKQLLIYVCKFKDYSETFDGFKKV